MTTISPVSLNSTNTNSFTSLESNKKNRASEKYSDPLNKWPIRGLAYSNELGAAISEIAPTLGTILWFPAMLYFGADIYDKYKNDQISFNPDAKRGTKQAIFQLLASVLLPTGAVLTGQKIASVLGSMGKSGLTCQTQEDISKFSVGFMQRRKLAKYQASQASYKEEFFTALDNQMSETLRESKIKNPLKVITDSIWKHIHPEYNDMSIVDKAHKFAEEGIDTTFRIREKLMNNEKPSEISDSMFKKFQKLKVSYGKNPEYAKNNVEYATKEILKEFESARIMKAKMIKTLGGFVALGLAIKPIDMFVENVIIKKYVEPNLSVLDYTQIKKYKEKHFLKKVEA